MNDNAAVSCLVSCPIVGPIGSGIPGWVVCAGMTAALACMTCGAELRSSAKFCDECGSPIAVAGTPAEYKQVTVLFADVVIPLAA